MYFFLHTHKIRIPYFILHIIIYSFNKYWCSYRVRDFATALAMTQKIQRVLQSQAPQTFITGAWYQPQYV